MSPSRSFDICWMWGALVAFLIVLVAVPVRAQSDAESRRSTDAALTIYPKEEFRGAWIATVLNLDWPRTNTPSAQQAELVEMLDELKAAGINAVFFQIRPEADALYDSSLEPWSVWLTGEQGVAPEPFWDPLAFAIEEAHKRGMELHAWLNPFRAARNADAAVADDHITVTHPEWILEIGNLKILNPGIPDVRSYIADVVMDVVTRYDVDGIHFDDYFYPYPPNEIGSEDLDTYEEFRLGTNQSLSSWRRYNINVFVREVFERILAYEDETGQIVKYGISPFGIWRSGVPEGIVGLSAYDTIYADAPNWLEQGWLDYLTPQLYWPFGGGQDYAKLAPWWATQMNGRHLYVGHGLYRADRNTFGGTLYQAREVPTQVRFNRLADGIQGSVFFRALNITRFSSRGFADSLRTDLYAYPALTPRMPWKNLLATPPSAPLSTDYTWSGEDQLTLTWTPPAVEEGATEARRYAVYRIPSDGPPDFDTALANPLNLIAVTGETQINDRPGVSDVPYYYVVTAVSANSVESDPSPYVVVEGRAVAVEPIDAPEAFTLDQNYPNPFNPTTEIAFTLNRPGLVTLTVYNALGQEVRRLLDETGLGTGPHRARWDGTDAAGQPVASGLYLYVLTDGTHRATRSMVLLN